MGTLADPKLDVQLKSSSDASVLKEQHIAWELEKPHYDKLRARSSTPKILVILSLPAHPDEWVTYSPESLMVRRCAYWTSLKNAPEITTATKTVHVPYSRPFSPEWLTAAMTKLSEEKELE